MLTVVTYAFRYGCPSITDTNLMATFRGSPEKVS